MIDSVSSGQSGQTVKSAGIVIDMISVQNLLVHSVASLGKTLNGTLSCLVVLANSFKFQADSNILASAKAIGDNCLPYALAPPSLSCESGE